MRQRSSTDTPVYDEQERMSNGSDASDEGRADGIDDLLGSNGTMRRRLVAVVRAGLLSQGSASMVRSGDVGGGPTDSARTEDADPSKYQRDYNDSFDAAISLPPLDGFADRLNRLFDVVRKPGQRPYTSVEVVDLVNMHGVGLSAPYLSQLRRGRRNRPSAKVVESLAFVFGVRPDYLTGGDSAYSAEVDRDLGWAQAAQDESVRELIASFLQLSAGDRNEILVLLDQWNRGEGSLVS